MHNLALNLLNHSLLSMYHKPLCLNRSIFAANSKIVYMQFLLTSTNEPYTLILQYPQIVIFTSPNHPNIQIHHSKWL